MSCNIYTSVKLQHYTWIFGQTFLTFPNLPRILDPRILKIFGLAGTLFIRYAYQRALQIPKFGLPCVGLHKIMHKKTVKIINFPFSDQSLKFGPNSGHFSQMSRILSLTRVFGPIGSPAERAV